MIGKGNEESIPLLKVLPRVLLCQMNSFCLKCCFDRNPNTQEFLPTLNIGIWLPSLFVLLSMFLCCHEYCNYHDLFLMCFIESWRKSSYLSLHTDRKLRILREKKKKMVSWVYRILDEKWLGFRIIDDNLEMSSPG